MTSSSNPKPQPTSPGWWWAKAYGKECVVEVLKRDEWLFVLYAGDEVETYVENPNITWLGPVISHDEAQRLREENRILRGTIDAQDEREQRAGVACGVPYELSTCDWLDAVADEVLALRQRVADLEAQQAQWDGPVQSRVEAYKRHVMGIVDHVHGQEGIASDYYGDGWKDACDEIRMNLEAKAGEA